MKRSSGYLVVCIVLLAASVFTVDLLVPLGVAVWLPYVAIVLLSLWLPGRWLTHVTAAACTVLTMAGLFLSPSGGDFAVALFNRLVAAFALWVTAFVGVAVRRTVELEKANASLKQEMARREKLEAQLLRSQRLESVGVLAGGIAHDFNNLLTPILMAVKLLREDRTPQERSRLLSTLQTSAERGADMVRQLLSFAGGGDGKRSLLQPAHILNEVKAILDHTFPKTLQIHTEVANDLYPVHADATQLSQVIINLCVNARDAMPTGGRISIQAENVHLGSQAESIHPDAQPGRYVCMEVADTGAGMPPDIVDRVFDPFFSTKGPGKGTGLGLSTALGIVRAHGGFITVSSEVGRGTRFSVYLPARTADEGWTSLAEDEAKSEAPPPVSGHGETILVVDDEPSILDTASAALESHGYRALTARTGKEAVAVYTRHRDEIQAVLVDMMMPNMDGATTIAALEQLDPKVRVIASSGFWTTERLVPGAIQRQGMFLVKPYTEEEMLVALGKVLNPQ